MLLIYFQYSDDYFYIFLLLLLFLFLLSFLFLYFHCSYVFFNVFIIIFKYILGRRGSLPDPHPRGGFLWKLAAMWLKVVFRSPHRIYVVSCSISVDCFKPYKLTLVSSSGRKSVSFSQSYREDRSYDHGKNEKIP